MFTGDRSGDWLFRSLCKAGFASQPGSTGLDDGLRLSGAWITAAAHCAPPDNRPTRDELRNCTDYLAHELEAALETDPVIVALGGIAFGVTLGVLANLGVTLPRPKPKFSHLGEVRLDERCCLIGSYHPSQQNTHTGRLTEPMLDRVFERAARLLAR
jgi:uracil-DNA glycosylase family 4